MFETNLKPSYFLFSIDFSFRTSIDCGEGFRNFIPIDIALSVNNEWMLRNMEKVIILHDAIRLIPHKTKIILQKLLNNTNCIFQMKSLKTVTELLGHRHFKINDKHGISLSLEDYRIRHKVSASKLKTKAENICKQVTKLQIEKNSKPPKDTIDLFPNLIDLQICHTELFDFNNYSSNHHETLQSKWDLSKFTKLKHLSLVFMSAHLSNTNAIHIPKQIETLKMDAIYYHSYDGLPIVIENDSVLHTLEIDCLKENQRYDSEIGNNNFIEILNLCNKLNHFKCLKINMDLNYRKFAEQLQDSTDIKRINKWKHNEKRTIIVTFKIEENNDYCLLSQNKMQTFLKQLFANHTNLIFHTKTQAKVVTKSMWSPYDNTTDEYTY